MSEEAAKFEVQKIVSDIEAVPELLRGFYEERDGKFHLQDVTALRNSMTNAKRERDEAKKRASHIEKWERIGKSPDEIAELLEAQKKAEEDKLSKAGEWDKLRAQMNEKHAAEIKAREDKLAAKDKAIERYLIDSQATAAIAAAKGVPDLLLPHVQRQVRVIEDNGEFVVRVVDAKGDPRVNGKGEPLTISDLVSEMRASDIFGRAFESSTNSGGGAVHPGGGSTNTPAGIPKSFADAKTLEEKAAFIKNQRAQAERKSA